MYDNPNSFILRTSIYIFIKMVTFIKNDPSDAKFGEVVAEVARFRSLLLLKVL